VSAPPYDVEPPLTRDPDGQMSVFGFSLSGWHRFACTDWGSLGDRTPVLCVPGLSRQSRDFDFLAEELARRAAGSYVLICCRTVAAVADSQVLSIMFSAKRRRPHHDHLRDGSKADQSGWNLLGGLIGIVLAGTPGSRIRGLVVNDIGPLVQSRSGNRRKARSDAGAVRKRSQMR